MEANNRQRNRQRIKGKDFVKGGVYEVYENENENERLLGIYFYPTSYPANMIFKYNSRGKLSKILNRISGPLELLILYSNIYHREKDEKGKYKKLYMKFDKSTIYGKKPVSIIKSESFYSTEIDLSDLDLSYAKLRDSHLVRVNLSNVNLTNANLTGSDLTGSDLTDSNLTGAKLGKTILNGIKSSQIIGSPDTLPKGYYLVEGCIIGPDTEISKSLKEKYRQIKINDNKSGRNKNETKQYLVGPEVNLVGIDLSKIEQFALNDSNLTGANLTGANLNRADLTGVNFTGANLTGANLTRVYLTGVNFTKVNLSGANLTLAKFYGTTLTGADLTDADLTDADLTGAKLTGIKTGGIKGIPNCLPKGYYLSDGYILGPDIDISNNGKNTYNTIKLKKKYKKIIIKNKKNNKEYLIGPKVDLTDVNLNDVDLTGIDLTNAILMNAILTGVDLTDVNLTGAVLTSIKSGGIKGVPKFLPDGYKLINGYIIGPSVNLYCADLTSADLNGANLTGANLTGADLANANLTGATLTNAILTDADLANSDLTGAKLTGIKSGKIKGNPRLPDGYKLIKGFIIGPNANLNRADLTGVDLTGVDLTDVNLYSADLYHITSGGIKGNPILPYRYVLINGYIIGPNVDLTGANLTGSDLTDVNLTGAVLTSIKSGGIKGNPRLPNKYKLINGYIIGPYVNLTDADLTDADLTGANLTGADLTDIKFGRIKGNPILPNGYVLTNGYIIGPNVDLNGADLTHVNLTGIKFGRIKGIPILPNRYVLINGYIIGPNSDLTGADLTGADLTGANLTGIVSGGIKGEPKLPRKYVLVNGYIIGPNSDLTGADLTGADLTYVNLSDSDLTSVDLTGSLLSYANLKGCNLTNATLVRVDLTRTNLKEANLTGTILSENSLSEKQKSEIMGEPVYQPKSVFLSFLSNIHISKRITDGKNKINIEQMDRAKRTVQNKNNEHAIREAYNKRMENKRKQNKEDKKESMKESIKKNILEKEKREPTQNEINRIYKNTKQRIKDSKKESIRKSFLEKEEREPTQKEINSIYKNTKKQKENKNFSDLLDYLLDKKNQIKISTKFQIVGESGINAGGLTRSIFEKCYKIFLERYFKKYNFNENYYVILKNLNEELFEEFKKACVFMIFFAKKGGVKILIQINPQLLELLQLGELKYYKKYVLLNNSNNSFSLKRLKEGINEGINEINENKIIESDFFNQLLENNGIFDYKHLDKVKEFYRLFWKPNPDIFTNHIDYSWDNFKERLRFQLPNSPYSFNSFDEFMTEENIQINTYPFIEFIIKYLKYSDEYRMRFTTLTCGSYTYTGPIYIKIFNKRSILDPFNAHTCFQTIDVNINLLDRYPVIYHELFCKRRNQVVNNPNESGRVNGRGSVRNESGNESGRVNVRESVRNESRNQIVNNRNGRVNNGNGSERVNNQNESGRVNNGNGSERVNNQNERGIVNNKSCIYLIEKLNNLIIDSINQGFNIA
jgi:uncharacterized protein YjbI with pentapeptide repeats